MNRYRKALRVTWFPSAGYKLNSFSSIIFGDVLPPHLWPVRTYCACTEDKCESVDEWDRLMIDTWIRSC